MKKLILAGIVIIICCLVFLIVQQHSSQADVDFDVYYKPYPVPFGEWVEVYLNSQYKVSNDYYFFEIVPIKGNSEGKFKYSVMVRFANNKRGQEWYRKLYLQIKDGIRGRCVLWTKRGYPISLSDFEFDVEMWF